MREFFYKYKYMHLVSIFVLSSVTGSLSAGLENNAGYSYLKNNQTQYNLTPGEYQSLFLSDNNFVKKDAFNSEELQALDNISDINLGNNKVNISNYIRYAIENNWLADNFSNQEKGISKIHTFHESDIGSAAYFEEKFKSRGGYQDIQDILDINNETRSLTSHMGENFQIMKGSLRLGHSIAKFAIPKYKNITKLESTISNVQNFPDRVKAIGDVVKLSKQLFSGGDSYDVQEILILLDSFSNSDLFSSTNELKEQIAQFNNLLKTEELLLPRNSELKNSFQVAKSELLYSALGSVLSMANEIADIDPTGKISTVLDTISSSVKFARTTHINDNIYRMEDNLSKMRETHPKLIKINQKARSSLVDISNNVRAFVKEAPPPSDAELVNEPVIEDTTIDDNTDLTDETKAEVNDENNAEIDEETDDDNERTFDRITTNKLGTGVFNTDSLEPKDENNQIKLSSRIGGGSVKQIETFDASDYFYTKLGKWSVMAGTPSNFSQGGYFATIDGTPTTAIQSLSGSATYSGNIIGEFVKSDGFRDGARGRIELSVNFSNQSVDAQFQLGHNCSSTSGSGSSNCGTLSRVAKITEPINDYLSSNGAGFGNHSDAARTSGESIVGIFGGPNGQEIAGDVSLADNGGIYNGVFQSNRGDIEEENDDDNGTVMVAMSTQTTDRYIIDDRLRMVENPGDQNSGFEFGISPDRGGGSVLTSERFSLGEYSYTNWGRWKATNLSPETHLAGGYWVSGHVTPENVIHDKTGSASYSGKMIGDFVSFEGAREAAHGDIALNANFTSNIVSGQMQWGHGGGAVSPLVEIYTGISGNGDFSMSSRNENTGLYYGVNGQFIGSTAQEVGGASWMHTQEGSYNGVFRAKQ